jgi:hypothetical protein
MPVYYFFDVPVYRLEETTYYAKMNEYINQVLFPPSVPHSDRLREIEKQNPEANVAIREHLRQSYGGGWRYNEIVGYIRLHFLGSQIRGEYFGVRKKRIVRTRKRVLEYQTWKLAPEIEIPDNSTSAEIFWIDIGVSRRLSEGVEGSIRGLKIN